MTHTRFNSNNKPGSMQGPEDMKDLINYDTQNFGGTMSSAFEPIRQAKTFTGLEGRS